MQQDLTDYDIKPKEFINYLRYYGPHFNKKLCQFACKYLSKCNYTKERLDTLLKQHNIELKNAKMHDYVYLANWCESTLCGSSISDEKHFVLFLKDIFDKEEHLIFNRWYADMSRLGIPIDWEEML